MVSRPLLIGVHLLVAVGGGYAATSGVTALAAVVLMSTILPRSEAVTLALMLVFPIYLAILIWAFAEPYLNRLCIILITIGIASWGGTWGLTRLAAGS